jgi:hypothetical protein
MGSSPFDPSETLQIAPSEPISFRVLTSVMRTSIVKNRLRRLGAALMVAAYAVGVLMPAVAFASADRSSIIHVLGEAHGGMLILHFHEDDGDHQHTAKPGSGPVHHCCGVTSLPGLEPEAAVSILPPETVTALRLPAEQMLSGQGAARLDRPPKISLTA